MTKRIEGAEGITGRRVNARFAGADKSMSWPEMIRHVDKGQTVLVPKNGRIPVCITSMRADVVIQIRRMILEHAARYGGRPMGLVTAIELILRQALPEPAFQIVIDAPAPSRLHRESRNKRIVQKPRHSREGQCPDCNGRGRIRVRAPHNPNLLISQACPMGCPDNDHKQALRDWAIGLIGDEDRVIAILEETRKRTKKEQGLR